MKNGKLCVILTNSALTEKRKSQNLDLAPVKLPNAAITTNGLSFVMQLQIVKRLAMLCYQPCLVNQARQVLHPLHDPLHQIAVAMLMNCILQSLVLKQSAGKQAPLSKESLAQQNATKEQLLWIQ